MDLLARVAPSGAAIQITGEGWFEAADRGTLFLDEIGDLPFRQDLFYRLHIVPVRLPPLRERPADIEAPALHFVAQLSRMRIASPIKSEPPSSSEYPAT